MRPRCHYWVNGDAITAVEKGFGKKISSLALALLSLPSEDRYPVGGWVHESEFWRESRLKMSVWKLSAYNWYVMLGMGRMWVDEKGTKNKPGKPQACRDLVKWRRWAISEVGVKPDKCGSLKPEYLEEEFTWQTMMSLLASWVTKAGHWWPLYKPCPWSDGDEHPIGVSWGENKKDEDTRQVWEWSVIYCYPRKIPRFSSLKQRQHLFCTQICNLVRALWGHCLLHLVSTGVPGRLGLESLTHPHVWWLSLADSQNPWMCLSFLTTWRLGSEASPERARPGPYHLWWPSLGSHMPIVFSWVEEKEK